MALRWSVEDLIRWRAKDLKDRNLEFRVTPESVTEMLSCENFPHDKIPSEAYQAITKFRHLRKDARVRKVQVVLGEGRIAKINERARVSNAVDDLYKKQREATAAIEALVEVKVAAALRESGQHQETLVQEIRALGQSIRALRQEWDALRKSLV